MSFQLMDNVCTKGPLLKARIWPASNNDARSLLVRVSAVQQMKNRLTQGFILPQLRTREHQGNSPELIGSLKLGNVWVFVRLISGPHRPMNQLNTKTQTLPNLRLPISSDHQGNSPNSLRVPTPTTSAVYSARSNDTFTWDCAARLYISVGLMVDMIFTKLQ